MPRMKRGTTAEQDMNSHSRRALRPSFARTLSLENKRAQGRPGAHRTHGPRATKSTRQNHRYRRIIRPSLRNGFNGVLRALLGDHAWLPPSPVRRESVFTTLAPASERQDHTTSPSAATSFVRALFSRLTLPRPPHPVPNVRDDREPPLFSGTRQSKEATDLGVRSIAA